jgi:hypothetical protein
LKPGEYPAQIIQVKLKVSKCGHFEQHGLRVRVEDAVNDHWEDFWETLTFSETAMWKVEQAMEAVGLNAGKECEVLPEHWENKQCRVELAEKEGKLQIKRWIKRAAVKAPMVRKMPDAVTRLRAAPAPMDEDAIPF